MDAAPASPRRAGPAAGALVVALVLAWVVLRRANAATDVPGVDWAATGPLAALGFGGLGALLVARRDGGLLGPLALGAALAQAVSLVAGEWAVLALLTEPRLPLGLWAEWLGGWAWLPGYLLVPTLLLALLPDGRLPSPRWRPLVPLSALAIGAVTLGWAVSPYDRLDVEPLTPASANPVAVPWLAGVAVVAGPLLLACVLASVAALVARARRARGEERQQLRWVLAGAGVTLALLLLAQALGPVPAAPFVSGAGLTVLPAAIAVAVVRHGLWDAPPAVRRGLVLGALAVAAAAAYAGAVLFVGAPVAAGAVAVVVALAARAPLERAINRLLYGQRDAPWAVVRALGDRLAVAGDPEQALREAAEAVRSALRLPHAEVRPPGGALEPGLHRVALVYAGEPVGDLVVAPRRPGRPLEAADRAALEQLAPSLAGAAHAARLTAELRASRERLVLAREDERRRVRNDLHDELGPALAILALRLDAARDASPQAGAVLGELAAQARDGVATVRRIVHDLRPPALDDLGLEGAVQARARDAGAAVRVPAPLGPLPAAVEVAAYRIVLEALANAARHAPGAGCTVELHRANGHLGVVVADDGPGLRAAGARGVGLRSMAERAAELGGALTVTDRPGGGTRVEATLPCAS